MSFSYSLGNIIQFYNGQKHIVLAKGTPINSAIINDYCYVLGCLDDKEMDGVDKDITHELLQYIKDGKCNLYTYESMSLAVARKYAAIDLFYADHVERTSVCISQSLDDGLTCKKCVDSYPYAIPNQVDGSLICYSCRNIP